MYKEKGRLRQSAACWTETWPAYLVHSPDSEPQLEATTTPKLPLPLPLPLLLLLLHICNLPGHELTTLYPILIRHTNPQPPHSLRRAAAQSSTPV